jgi:hypothetical protein
MVDGVFYFDLDNTTGRYINRQLFEFEPWFLKEAVARGNDKDPEEMFDFMTRHLIRRNSGDLIFLAENELIRDYNTYQNIIAINFGPGGVQKWKRVIVKRQGIDKYTAFNYSSYSVHAPWYSDKIHLIFNDHIRNPEWPEEEKIKRE